MKEYSEKQALVLAESIARKFLALNIEPRNFRIHLDTSKRRIHLLFQTTRSLTYKGNTTYEFQSLYSFELPTNCCKSYVTDAINIFIFTVRDVLKKS